MMTKQVGIRNLGAQQSLQLLQSQIKWDFDQRQFYVVPKQLLYIYPLFCECCESQFAEAMKALRKHYHNRNLRENDINKWFQYTVGACASEWYDVLLTQDIYIGRDAKIKNEVKLLDWENLRLIEQDPEVQSISDTHHHANILEYVLRQPQINTTAQATAQVYRPFVIIPVLADYRKSEVSRAIGVIKQRDSARRVEAQRERTQPIQNANRFVIVQYSLEDFNNIVNETLRFAQFYDRQEEERLTQFYDRQESQRKRQQEQERLTQFYDRQESQRKRERRKQRQQAQEAEHRRKPPPNRGSPQQSRFQTSPGYDNRYAAPEFTQQRTQPGARGRRGFVPQRRPRPPPGRRQQRQGRRQQSRLQTSPGYSNRYAAPEFTQQQRTQPRAGGRRVVVPQRRKPPPPPGPPPGRRRQLQGPPPGPFTNYQELVLKMFDLRF